MAVQDRPAGEAAHAKRAEACELDTLFTGLVHDYHRHIYNYLFRILGDDCLAEDLTQETYLRAFRGLPKLPPGANYRAWLYRIATNAATDEIRKVKRHPVVTITDKLRLRARSESEDDRLGRVSLDDALMSIPPRHRAILNLFEYAELTAPEVGEVLGITPEAARKRRQRARQALAAALEGPER